MLEVEITKLLPLPVERTTLKIKMKGKLLNKNRACPPAVPSL